MYVFAIAAELGPKLVLLALLALFRRGGVAAKRSEYDALESLVLAGDKRGKSASEFGMGFSDESCVLVSGRSVIVGSVACAYPF